MVVIIVWFISDAQDHTEYSGQPGAMTAMQASISIEYKEQSVILDVSAAQTAEDVNAIVAASFNLHKGSRFVLRRAEDGAIMVAGPALAAGKYDLQLVDGECSSILCGDD